MKDLYLTNDGDLLIDPDTGDLMISEGDRTLEQRVLFHLKTLAGDYLLVPELGASLESFIGEDNTAATGTRIQKAVEDSLLNDPSIARSLLKVDVAPLNKNEIIIAVVLQIEPDGEPVTIMSGLSLNEGYVFSR